ncbi:hypothetical protein [Actinomyces faecalis]|uniref:hypothetical protein n=1 Tax=Actinomyces faecalis TaxID=2722820 RepID=UPI00155511AC|nr:hypothetical protein [Actinomyces faecalis]
MSTDPLLGPMGTPLDAVARQGLADGDAASCIEQVRWARHAAVLTPTGGLVRAVDTGHRPGDIMGRLRADGGIPDPVAVCGTCGQGWPCRSRRLEAGAGL